jgi:hypothetical protein
MSATPKWDAFLRACCPSERIRRIILSFAVREAQSAEHGIEASMTWATRAPLSKEQRARCIEDIVQQAGGWRISMYAGAASCQVPIPIFLHHVHSDDLVKLRYNGEAFVRTLVECVGRIEDVEDIGRMFEEVDEFQRALFQKYGENRPPKSGGEDA